MLVVVTASAVAFIIVSLSSSRIDSLARRSAADSEFAVTAARLQAELAEPTLILANGYMSTLFNPSFLDLPPGEQLKARADVASTLLGHSLSQTSTLGMPIGDRELLTLHDRLNAVDEGLDDLVSMPRGGLSLIGVTGRQTDLQRAFNDYLGDASLTNYNRLFRAIVELRVELNSASTVITEELAAGSEALASSKTFARYALGFSLSGLILILTITTFSIGRMLHSLFRRSQAEHRDLLQTTDSLSYRNQQLTALYNVFSEITETLSVRHVIQASLRESLKVMHANMCVMRLLKGDELVVAGGLNDAGEDFSSLPPVPLGEGPMGRAARRGRTVYVRDGAQEQLGPSTNLERRVESGIVVPLIVGARVVGTLACWSRQVDAFDEEDQRVLEMMASQVATALIAADTTDINDHRARHDPLTGLPNRVQLEDDIARELGLLASHSRRAVVAMVDIDWFKRFNDDFGHRVGDATLQKVAAVLRSAVREKDRIYRYGGEEFLLVFVDAGIEEAVHLAERVRHAVESTTLDDENLDPVGRVTISIGLSALPDHSTDFSDLIEKADTAMYGAKASGRNRVMLWEESPQGKRATMVA